jgi:hypothetical protein
MYSDWQAAAQKQIAILDKQFSPEMTWQERQKVLRAGASNFHGDTSWGKRVWAKHCRAYLELHGKPKRDQPVPLFPDDIIFPFRNTGGSHG